MFNHQKNQLNTLQAMFFSNLEFKVIWATILGSFTYLTGCVENVLIALIILIGVDTILGAVVAYKNKRLASYNFFGLLLFKLFLYLALMVMSYQAISLISNEVLKCILELSRDLVMLGIAITEVISTLESATLLGFKWARKVISKINDNVQEKILK